MDEQPFIERQLVRLHVDWAPTREPASPLRTLLVFLVSLGGALAANAALVKIATTATPSLRSYPHFRFVDYGSLTALGIVGACAAWYVVSRISSAPRWFFFRLALGVTALFFLPDVWLLAGGQPVRGVLTLAGMHVVMALWTYNLLVRGAPPGADPVAVAEVTTTTRGEISQTGETNEPGENLRPRYGAQFGRPTWLAMMVGVALEFVAGLVELVSVPFDRPNGYLPSSALAISLVHALVGGLLGIGATAMVLLVTRDDRMARMGARGGFIGVVLGGIGGTACYYHSLRLPGIGLMFVGASVAFFSYLIPLLGNSLREPDLKRPREADLTTGE
ncbi:MAG: hypothetical protein HKL87_02480 [Acidimicrobiaceae bacterium]|nr:hypothetical protein [Acidimicrobiaceae bacterium]